MSVLLRSATRVRSFFKPYIARNRAGLRDNVVFYFASKLITDSSFVLWVWEKLVDFAHEDRVQSMKDWRGAIWRRKQRIAHLDGHIHCPETSVLPRNPARPASRKSRGFACTKIQGALPRKNCQLNRRLTNGTDEAMQEVLATRLRRFDTKTRTNWHCQCANAVFLVIFRPESAADRFVSLRDLPRSVVCRPS
jgi:hypothetical protein